MKIINMYGFDIPEDCCESDSLFLTCDKDENPCSLFHTDTIFPECVPTGGSVYDGELKEGKFEAHTLYDVCETCNGSGHLVCKTCGGTGSDIFGDGDPCPDCPNGSGWNTCETCGGSGYTDETPL